MLQFLQKSKQSKVKKHYRMKYYDGDVYMSIKYDSLLIEATSRLEAIVKLKDYFNEHGKCPYAFDAFEDESLNDIVCEYQDIDSEDVESIFNSKHITEIIERYVESQFNDDTLWLVECHE